MEVDVQDPMRLADVVCANLEADVGEKQEVLMETEPKKKIKMVLTLLNREIEVLPSPPLAPKP